MQSSNEIFIIRMINTQMKLKVVKQPRVVRLIKILTCWSYSRCFGSTTVSHLITPPTTRDHWLLFHYVLVETLATNISVSLTVKCLLAFLNSVFNLFSFFYTTTPTVVKRAHNELAVATTTNQIKISTRRWSRTGGAAASHSWFFRTKQYPAVVLQLTVERLTCWCRFKNCFFSGDLKILMEIYLTRKTLIYTWLIIIMNCKSVHLLG